jgi:hypothetical protein
MSDTKDPWDFPILNQISRLIAGNLFPIYQFTTERIESIPNSIEIGYGEKVQIDVGLVDMTEENASTFTTVKETQPVLTARYLDFSVEFPDFSSDGWFVNFNPTNVYFEEGNVLKTNMTIQLNNPRVPVQSGRIRIKVTDYWVFSNVWFPEGWDNWYPFKKAGWFIAAVTAGFGKYSGQVAPEYFYFDILVNVKPFKDVQIEALDLVKLKPNEVTSIPIIVKNRGNYNDTFSFKITSEHETIKIVDPTVVSLKPGQSTNTFLAVAVPDYVVDVGTVHPINIEVYSTDAPNVTIASQKVMLETQGLYVSEMNGIFFGLIIILFIFIILIILRKIRQIPEKKTVDVKTKKEKENKKSERFFSKLFEKPKEKPKKQEKKQKTEPKAKPVKKEEIVETEVVKEKPVIKPKFDLKSEEERRKKEKALAKIRKKQGK